MENSHADLSHQTIPPQPSLLSLLDGCKGVAIAAIVLFHYQKGWFGWQGVHLFIVLSGFGLTYSSLKQNRTQGWRQWYVRRAEKILPSYWLVCLCGLVWTIFLQKLIWTPDSRIKTITVKAMIEFVLDSLLLRNFSYQTMFGSLNASLWFVPFIVGFYLIFPWLYLSISKLVASHKLTANHRSVENHDLTSVRNPITSVSAAKTYLFILLMAAIVEFGYRAIALYGLDGIPVGYGHGFLKVLPLSVSSLERFSDMPAFPFQQWAPFGFFPSRLAEFVLGMVAALLFVHHPDRLPRSILNGWAGFAGFCLWLGGNYLLYVGLWGWIFADFVIAMGLTLWVLNLMWLCQTRCRFLFLQMDALGQSSYYTFLTHLLVAYLVVYPFAEQEANLIADANYGAVLLLKMITLGALIALTALANQFLVKFDRSKWPKRLIEGSIAKLLKPS